MDVCCKNTHRVLIAKEQLTKGQEPERINSHLF